MALRIVVLLVLSSCASRTQDTPPEKPKATSGCSTNADCPAHFSCEGEGCAPNAGTCVSVERTCTADSVGFCTCDGKTIMSSSACPGVRYRHAGACP